MKRASLAFIILSALPIALSTYARGRRTAGRRQLRRSVRAAARREAPGDGRSGGGAARGSGQAHPAPAEPAPAAAATPGRRHRGRASASVERRRALQRGPRDRAVHLGFCLRRARGWPVRRRTHRQRHDHRRFPRLRPDVRHRDARQRRTDHDLAADLSPGRRSSVTPSCEARTAASISTAPPTPPSSTRAPRPTSTMAGMPTVTGSAAGFSLALGPGLRLWVHDQIAIGYVARLRINYLSGE